MKSIVKKSMSLVLVAMFAVMAMAAAPSADAQQRATLDLWGGQKNAVTNSLGLGTKDIRATVASIINVALGLLGIVAVVIVLIGGFKWMTAGGEQGKVDEAKKLITSGIIGLAIIVSAYAIAQFVVDSLMRATGNTP